MSMSMSMDAYEAAIAAAYARGRDECRAPESRLTAALARAEKAEVGMIALGDRIQKTNEELDTLRDRLGALTAPVEGEPTDEDLLAAWNRAFDEAVRNADGRRALYRFCAAHERARHQPTEPRATEQELLDIYAGAERCDDIRGGLRAIATRVRSERCLVERAVAGGWDLGLKVHSCGVDVTISRAKEQGRDEGEWFEGALVEHTYENVAPADVPRVLAEMLTEVGA